MCVCARLLSLTEPTFARSNQDPEPGSHMCAMMMCVFVCVILYMRLCKCINDGGKYQKI